MTGCVRKLGGGIIHVWNVSIHEEGLLDNKSADGLRSAESECPRAATTMLWADRQGQGRSEGHLECNIKICRCMMNNQQYTKEMGKEYLSGSGPPW